MQAREAVHQQLRAAERDKVAATCAPACLVMRAVGARRRFRLERTGELRTRQMKGGDAQHTFKLQRFGGECVWCLKPQMLGGCKADVMCDRGIWLVIRCTARAVYVGADEGVIEVRTVRRKGKEDTSLDETTKWKKRHGNQSQEERASK